MSEISSKTPQQIIVRVTDRDIDAGMSSELQTQENTSLAELISRYLIRLGFDSAFTSGIIVQLLTKGKVRVDFSKITERLELIDLGDHMAAPQAMQLYQNYVDSMQDENDESQKSKTVRIVVQHPKD